MTLTEFKLFITIVGTAINQWVGGLDELLTVLVVFMIADYITGVCCAIIEHKLSSSVGAKGILQKVLIFVLVAVANAIDVHIIEGDQAILRTAVIFFYLSNEGISILENSARLGLPIPDKLKDFLSQIKDKGH